MESESGKRVEPRLVIDDATYGGNRGGSEIFIEHQHVARRKLGTAASGRTKRAKLLCSRTFMVGDYRGRAPDVAQEVAGSRPVTHRQDKARNP